MRLRGRLLNAAREEEILGRPIDFRVLLMLWNSLLLSELAFRRCDFGVDEIEEIKEELRRFFKTFGEPRRIFFL